jgi:hypothetical protein
MSTYDPDNPSSRHHSVALSLQSPVEPASIGIRLQQQRLLSATFLSLMLSQ